MGMRELWRREEWGGVRKGQTGVRRLERYPGRSVGGNDDACRVRFPDHAACYFPQKRAKSRFFDVCRDVAKDKGARPLLIVGDLNTGNQMSDRTPSGTKYDCSEDFDRLSQREGLVDLWRKSNGADTREWTWRSTAGNGFRLDHAFGNEMFVDRFGPSCCYDHRP